MLVNDHVGFCRHDQFNNMNAYDRPVKLNSWFCCRQLGLKIFQQFNLVAIQKDLAVIFQYLKQA